MVWVLLWLGYSTTNKYCMSITLVRVYYNNKNKYCISCLVLQYYENYSAQGILQQKMLTSPMSFGVTFIVAALSKMLENYTHWKKINE